MVSEKRIAEGLPKNLQTFLSTCYAFGSALYAFSSTS
jgi:hypothetical protein